MKRILALLLLTLTMVGAATAAPPPRHAYPAKGNLPALRNRMLKGCIPQAGGNDVCPLPAPRSFAQCVNSPTKSFAAACGGYPLPPWCFYANPGVNWFGHYWAYRAYSGGYEYVQTSFTCGNSSAASYALANWLGGISSPNVRFTPPYFWAGIVYD